MSKINRIQLAKDLVAVLDKHLPNYGKSGDIFVQKEDIEAILSTLLPLAASRAAIYGIMVAAVTEDPEATATVLHHVASDFAEELQAATQDLLELAPATKNTFN